MWIIRGFLLIPVLLGCLALLAAATAFGGSATWNLNPANGSWDIDDPTNWTPATVPNGPADTATFGVSNTTDVEVSDVNYFVIEVNGIVFNAGASAFTITAKSEGSFDFYLTISGVGITNNSGITQNFGFPQGGQFAIIQFTNSATAGSLTAFANEITDFFDTSSAGTGTFTTFTTEFFDSATADNATLISNGVGGTTTFFNTSTAGNATLIANAVGGSILFEGDSTGGTARVQVFGNGNLDISTHNAPGVTVGSIKGNGVVFLGARDLSAGSNNLNTTFSGIIQDGGIGGGTGGSLTKVGTGRLILTKANTYTGGTTIEGGKLGVQNKSGSGTGTGAVQVNAGVLGGGGTIAGAVTVGTGASSGAVLSPGGTGAKSGTLTILSTLTFGSDANYKVASDSATVTAEEVIANGVTINSGARFSFADSHASVLPLGTVFTVIDNTAATPIAGTFSNLADGSTFTVNANTFQASYEGGDGNDLTLTVQ